MLDRDVDPRELEPEDLESTPTDEDAVEPAVCVSGDVPLEVGEADWLENSVDPGDDADDERDRPG
jgi:hypothetical protein